MKKIIKTLIFIVITTLFTGQLISATQTSIYAEVPNSNTKTPVNIAVFLYDLNDKWINLVKQNLENIQKEHNGEVNFTFFDAKGNQLIQNQDIDNVLKQRFDALIVNFTDIRSDSISDIITRITKRNIPLIIFGDPTESLLNLVKLNNKAIFVSSDNEQCGNLQGQIIVNEWNHNKAAIDKNNDNVLQYIMLRGRNNNVAADIRTKYSISTINNAGIKTQELETTYGGWNEETARTAIESLFLTYNDRIEAIISNNDAMAIGAVKALQKYGFNNGNKEKNIPIVGADGIPEAIDLIKKGFMTGTTIQDSTNAAQALYNVGLNLALGKYALENTDYKFDSTGITIRLPFAEYKP
ncbi:galactose ABC transporter substrate-binding protein [Clostridium saccharobutylicum]|uniref:D-galactose/methyl-galactoside binding periplasmic protein MglB n=1 Tax=Clostridium saccharobutylicum TaxID=169679 RepID=A0A1S8NHT1_CLOSA|nr:galactose ABC transporter substrate-binding protein [Clostridium saccharobutylicum]OOM16044.1 D-galactose-binding periplasmic protein precursor [Clostridium saccharobutylicum]